MFWIQTKKYIFEAPAPPYAFSISLYPKISHARKFDKLAINCISLFSYWIHSNFRRMSIVYTYFLLMRRLSYITFHEHDKMYVMLCSLYLYICVHQAALQHNIYIYSHIYKMYFVQVAVLHPHPPDPPTQRTCLSYKRDKLWVEIECKFLTCSLSILRIWLYPADMSYRAHPTTHPYRPLVWKKKLCMPDIFFLHSYMLNSNIS